jgi:undecaprenyl diphosphate synthase
MVTSTAAEAAPGAQPEPPAHVAVIMDGNGRWAKARGLPRIAGHRKGADAARTVVETAAPAAEINDLMGLLRIYLSRELKVLQENDIRLRAIGDRARLPGDIQSLIDEAERRTQGNGRMTLVLALSYGGRADIARAARNLARAAADGRLDPDAIDETRFAAALETHGIPEPDLLIRTSGEQRISNFLLWEMAYTEFVFTDTLWPDFGADAFLQGIDAFHLRERRYGAS